jgi:hypothetical protein
VLAETTVCTVVERADGSLEVELGDVTVSLPRQQFASLAGTLQRTVPKLFGKGASKPSSHLRLVWDAAHAAVEEPALAE